VSGDRIDGIRARLNAALSPRSVAIRDDSAMHAGHAGAAGGAGHYTVLIEADAFKGLRQLQRHRLVYQAVADMMPHEIHALSIDASAPGER
jgi:BolA protein